MAIEKDVVQWMRFFSSCFVYWEGAGRARLGISLLSSWAIND